MKLSQPPLLSTHRLELRPFLDNDYAAYAAYHCQAAVYQFLYMAVPTSATLHTQFEEILRAPFACDGDVCHLAVVRKEDKALVGEVLLKIASLEALQLEVGYIFNPAYAGQGLATEAASAALRFGFESIGAHRIFARLDALNTASAKVAQRLGMRKEAHLVQNDRFNGVWGDEFIFAMLQSEWLASEGASPA